MVDINSFLEYLSKMSGEITTIMALLAIIIPKTRKIITSRLKEGLGLNEIKEKIQEQSKKYDELREKTESRDKMIQKIDETLDAHVGRYNEYTKNAKERDIFFLRTEIDNIYHKYMPLGYITVRAKTDVSKAYELYLSMGGNSYAKKEVEELLDLPVKF